MTSDPDAVASTWEAISPGGRAYAQHFETLAASGADVHGEATFCWNLLRGDEPAPAPGTRVIDAGCGTGRVAIELARRGLNCAGVDADADMLAQAAATAPALPWVLGDLAALPVHPDLRPGADLVVAAGNVIPLLSPGTHPQAIAAMSALLREGGYLVTGFGLDPAHLPLAQAPVDLASYDQWCEQAGLRLHSRFGTWDGGAPSDGYAVSVHVR